jgi:hypothetical protein
MTATLAPPAACEVLAFYERCRPLVEQLATMAREWRDVASEEATSAAIEAHGEFFWLAARLDLRLRRCRATPAPGTQQGVHRI